MKSRAGFLGWVGEGRVAVWWRLAWIGGDSSGEWRSAANHADVLSCDVQQATAASLSKRTQRVGHEERIRGLPNWACAPDERSSGGLATTKCLAERTTDIRSV